MNLYDTLITSRSCEISLFTVSTLIVPFRDVQTANDECKKKDFSQFD